MAGGNMPRPDCVGHLQEAVEFDVVVTKGAGDRGPAGEVLVDERLYDLLLELLLEVHDVVRDPDLLGDAPRVANIVERAAAAGGAFHGQLRQSPLVPQLHR